MSHLSVRTTLEALLSLMPTPAHADSLRAALDNRDQDDIAGVRDWLQTQGVALMIDEKEPQPVRAALRQIVTHLTLGPRPGVGLNTAGLPDLVWCAVPAGSFLMGSDKKRDMYAYRTEMPQKELVLPAYSISQYPITYAQFEVFAQAKDVYDPAWWQGFPEACQPQTLTEAAVTLADHPRGGVSGYQATAFCRWLTAHARTRGLIASHEIIRLPLDTEWEKAARGPDGRVYPYSDDSDPLCANTSELALERTTPVGFFPCGASPYGALDMSGNVYEWCLSTRPPQEEAEGEIQILRGGSYFLRIEWSRCAYRYEREASLALPDFGFRVVKAEEKRV